MTRFHRSSRWVRAAYAVSLATLLSAGAHATALNSGTGPSTSGGTFIDFEGQAEGNAATLYSGLGVTFTANAGNPLIDNSPFSFFYTANSGVGVLSIDTVPAGLGINLATAANSVEFFFSDTAPLGNYVVSAFDASSVLLEAFTLTLADVTADGSRWLGFVRGSSDISRVTIVPVDGTDAFALDDLRFGSSAVPEPATLALAAMALLGAGMAGRKRKG